MAFVSRTIMPVWLVTLVGAVAVGVFAGSAYLTWLPVVLAAALLLTFAIQLALQRKEQTVTRMVWSIAGSLVITLAATVVLAVLHPATPLIASVEWLS